MHLSLLLNVANSNLSLARSAMRIMKKIFCEIGKKKVSCKARIDLDAGSMLAVRVGLLKPRRPWHK